MEIAAIIGAVLSAVVSVVTGIKSIRNTREINDTNIQNQWDMYHETNEYNTPLEQMQRFQDAGLNPHLIYGQTNMATPMNVGIAQRNDYSSFQNLIPNLLSTLGTSADFFQGKQHLDNEKIQEDILAIDKQIKLIDQAFQSENANYKLDMSEAEVRQLEASIKNMAQAFEIGEFEKSIKEAESIIAQADLDFQLPMYDWRKGITEVSKYADTILNLITMILNLVRKKK